jgi:hypothetical protein
MLITERKFGVFTILYIYFANVPVTLTLPDFDVVTYHTYKDWGEIKGFERKKSFTTTIYLSQPLDTIWNNIKRQHKRHIRRSQKNGIKISMSDNYEEFYQLYKKFLKQKNYTDTFETNIYSLKFIKKYGIIFIAEKDGKMLCGNLYFHDEKNVCLESSVHQITENTIDNKKASIDAYCDIQWKAIQYFKNLGIINFDLGGVNYHTSKFGGEVISRYEYRKFNSHFHKFLFHSWNFLRIYE